MFFHALRLHVSVTGWNGEKNPNGKHEEWKWTRAIPPRNSTQFPHLTLNFHRKPFQVLLCEWKGISAILRFSCRENESDSRPAAPNIFSERVFLDRLLRHSTFSSCFPFLLNSAHRTDRRRHSTPERWYEKRRVHFLSSAQLGKCSRLHKGEKWRCCLWGEGWVYITLVPLA